MSDSVTLLELQRFRGPLKAFKERDTGKSNVFLEGGSTCRERECSLGNLLTTAIWNENLRPPNNDSWTTASSAVVNAGAFRQSVQPGDITVEDVLEALPYRDTIMAIDMEGRHIIEMLEHSIEDYDPDQLKGKFLQMSGIKVVYDLSKPNGERVKEVFIRCTHCDVPRFEALLPNNTYTLFVCTFLTSGGDGYTMVPKYARNVVPYGRKTSSSLVSYNTQRFLETIYRGLHLLLAVVCWLN
ncbi:Apyrase [Lamellibrachia satsuma]|nr:Apyrase [Lamellibrachia satsuma]